MQNQNETAEETGFIGPQHAVNAAQQSDEGGFSIQTNGASCVFVRQEGSCPTKTTCPPDGRGNFLQSRKFWKRKEYEPYYPKSMKEESRTRTGRKPKSDPADYKYSFRLNAEENSKFERLVADADARDKTLFIKKAIFGGQIKVVKIDKATMDYYIKLTEFHKQFQAIGNNYNQVVRAVKTNFGEKRAMSLLYQLEKATIELMLLTKKIMALTQEYEQKWLQK